MSYIELNKITKTFKVTAGIKTGIMDINLKIEKGETLGIVGINGAGKTTLIRHLMGFYKQKSGTISIAGLNP
jgi:ABC-2 type transport system ATP-binding protein